ncbi:CBS domain-containing protein [Halorubrum lipolyticum]|uniref:XRE family transcriptional regulator n=1 Tax=Halorubrum lipolyticum DSM 21995 TaxID=1227482 RepID=M0P4A4_9EURY|nr:CBS domain-containing protein [Halorubrum lipolyticum]EMA64628.1 XRE family transcriptional regulator [Halorubrum lipolyticum DSM 21995]
MRTDTTVRDVMHREFLGVSESDPLRDAAALLVDEGTNCLVVLRGGEPVGRLGCRDALGALLDAGVGAGDGPTADGESGLTVGSVMGPPLPTVAPDDALAAVEERLVSEGVDRVVAVENGEAVGVVTAGDALAAGAPRTGNGAREPLPDEEATGEPRRGDAATLGSDGGVDPAVEASSTDASGSPTQGVCESCGALVPDLVTANGQAVCPECREV